MIMTKMRIIEIVVNVFTVVNDKNDNRPILRTDVILPGLFQN